MVASRRFFHSAAALRKEVAAAPAGKLAELTLNFASPNRAIVNKKEIKLVTVPGREGALGLEKNAPPMVSELRPGVVRVDYLDNTSEEVFIPGGFAFKHPNNSLDISAPEAVKLDTIDVEALRSANAEAVKALAAAGSDVKAAAEAKIALEVYGALGKSLKISL